LTTESQKELRKEVLEEKGLWAIKRIECGEMLPNCSGPKIGVQRQDVVIRERSGTKSCRKKKKIIMIIIIQ
jgi:hypothetical protein